MNFIVHGLNESKTFSSFWTLGIDNPADTALAVFGSTETEAEPLYFMAQGTEVTGEPVENSNLIKLESIDGIAVTQELFVKAQGLELKQTAA